MADRDTAHVTFGLGVTPPGTIAGKAGHTEGTGKTKDIGFAPWPDFLRLAGRGPASG